MIDLRNSGGSGTLDGDWRVSTRCSNGTCIEVRLDNGVVEVRDSTDPNGPVLQFSPIAWRSSLKGITDGALHKV